MSQKQRPVLQALSNVFRLSPSLLSLSSRAYQDRKRCHREAAGKCNVWLLFSRLGPSQAFLGPKTKVGKYTACPLSPLILTRKARAACAWVCCLSTSPASLPSPTLHSSPFNAWGARLGKRDIREVTTPTRGQHLGASWRFCASFLYTHFPYQDLCFRSTLWVANRVSLREVSQSHPWAGGPFPNALRAGVSLVPIHLPSMAKKKSKLPSSKGWGHSRGQSQALKYAILSQNSCVMIETWANFALDSDRQVCFHPAGVVRATATHGTPCLQLLSWALRACSVFVGRLLGVPRWPRALYGWGTPPKEVPWQLAGLFPQCNPGPSRPYSLLFRPSVFLSPYHYIIISPLLPGCFPSSHCWVCGKVRSLSLCPFFLLVSPRPVRSCRLSCQFPSFVCCLNVWAELGPKTNKSTNKHKQIGHFQADREVPTISPPIGGYVYKRVDITSVLRPGWS